ncbi:MAG TPA: SpoIIE family protein phosphatase [Acidimicrobiia bacterium]|nr:SpoIIE family protein phosphatase [Acidimicrobiia bacterium]
MSEASEERRLWGEVDPRWRRRFGVVAEAAGLVVLVGASLALVGRVLSVPILAQWIPELTVRPMQPATAFLFMMGGLSLLGALVSTGRWTRVLGILAAAVVLAGGISVIVANVANLRFPRWLLSSLTAEDVVGGELPARPALNEGAVLAACGAALILLATRSRIAHIFGQVLAVAAAMVGATVIVAFAYGDDTLRGFPLGSGRMAISAALLTVVFCAGIVIARPGLGIMAPIISPWPGGIVLRRLLPIILAGPPVAIAWLLGATTPAEQPRSFAAAAVLASGLLAAALFATAAAVSQAARRLAVAEDLADRAAAAVSRDAAIVDVLLGRLSDYRASVEGLDVAVRFRPAEGWLAGDAALTVPLGQSRLAAILVDIVGHGPEPAVAALRLSDAIQHALRQGAGPAAAIAASRWVLDDGGVMASVAVTEVDSRTGAVIYASAGSPPILHRRAREIRQYEATGPILIGGDEQAKWDEGAAVIDEGEALVLFSDGLADPTGPHEVAVASVEDLTQALVRCPYVDADRLADWCLEESLGQAEGVARDDASLIVIGRAPRKGADNPPDV